MICASETNTGHPLLKIIATIPSTEILPSASKRGKRTPPTPKEDPGSTQIKTSEKQEHLEMGGNSSTDSPSPGSIQGNLPGGAPHTESGNDGGVEAQGALATEYSTVEVEHLIPFVRSIVPRIDPGKRRLLVDPPSGLLDLGRRRALLQHLKGELLSFIREKSTENNKNNTSSTNSTESLINPTTTSSSPAAPAAAAAAAPMSNFVMPMRRELEAAGRYDLVKAIQCAGGFIEVAQELGLRSMRRPPGYWDDDEALDRELSLFVAANWVRFEEGPSDKLESAMFLDPGEGLTMLDADEDEEENQEKEWDNGENEESEEEGSEFSDTQQASHTQQAHHEVYWYNQVTRKLRWSPPVLLSPWTTKGAPCSQKVQRIVQCHLEVRFSQQAGMICMLRS